MPISTAEANHDPEPHPGPPDPDRSAPPALRRERLDAMADGAPEFLRELATLFLAFAARSTRDALDALRAGDPDGLAAAAHGLKGASLTVGAEALAATAHDLETLARARPFDPDAARAGLARLRSRWEALRPELAPLTPGVDWPEPFDGSGTETVSRDGDRGST